MELEASNTGGASGANAEWAILDTSSATSQGGQHCPRCNFFVSAVSARGPDLGPEATVNRRKSLPKAARHKQKQEMQERRAARDRER